jgi:hypothetical protein
MTLHVSEVVATLPSAKLTEATADRGGNLLASVAPGVCGGRLVAEFISAR